MCSFYHARQQFFIVQGHKQFVQNEVYHAPRNTDPSTNAGRGEASHPDSIQTVYFCVPDMGLVVYVSQDLSINEFVTSDDKGI